MGQNQIPTQEKWEKLRDILIETSGVKKAYFSPPSDIKLTYPCIIFEFDGNSVQNANNHKYRKHDRYSVNYISRRYDETTINAIDDLPLCSLERHYVADGLYHTLFNLYF